MFLGFCCKVLLRKKGVRVLYGIEPYVTLPLLRAGDIHDRGVQAGILTSCLLVRECGVLRRGRDGELREGAARRCGRAGVRSEHEDCQLAAAALVGGGALRGLAEKSESFVMRRRGDRAVWRGERGDEELHAIVQQRPGSRAILKHRALMSGSRPPLPLETGSQGGGHLQRRGRSYLSKFRASVR